MLLGESLGWENALCFIKPISSAAPGGTMLASHWGSSVCKTQEGRCLLEQHRYWPGWYLLKQWTGCNWLVSADFTLTDIQLLQLQTLSQAFLEHTQPHLSPCSRSCLLTHQHQVSLLYGSLKLHQLLPWHRDNSTKPRDRASVLFASGKQHFTVLRGRGVSWSLTLAGKVSQALTVGSVQRQSAYKCRETQECQGSDKVECHKVP